MGGFTSENNKKNPRIYNNTDELSLCSLFVKEFKIALHPVLKFLVDGTLHLRLMKLFMRIKALDRKSASGSKNVGEGLRTLKGQQLLREFVFTPKAGIRQQIGNPRIDEKNFSLEWEKFDSSFVKFPKGATHFELYYILVAYDIDLNVFETFGGDCVRRSKEDRMEQLQLRLEKEVKKREGFLYMPVLGIRFIEILGDEEYNCAGKNAVGVEVLTVVG